MDVDRWRTVLAIVDEVMGEPAPRRADLVLRRCSGDDELREAVAALLLADGEPAAFLRPPEDGEVCGLLGRAALGLRRGDRVGRFVIVDVVATGGTATVYEALGGSPRRRVALKVLRLGPGSFARRRFAFECEALGRLRHPGIARIHEAGIHRSGPESELPYLAMEFVEGGRTIVEHADDRRLDLGARLALMAAVCDAVEHGHREGVVHRDLKPANLLVSRAGEVKVIDFGLARAVDVEPGRTTVLSEAGQLIGTLGYMSPEQLDGDPRTVDVRSDVYALGIVLYELACGRRAFALGDASVAEATRVVLESELVPLRAHDPSLPAELDAVVRRATAKRAVDRLPSAAALAVALRRIAARPPVTDGGATP